MTAAELASYDTGPALVAYLAQPDASASVCDDRAHGPHVGVLVPPMRDALVRGLVDGRVPPEIWLKCADSLVTRAPPDEAASFLDETGRAYRQLVKDSKFEATPAMQARVVAMQRLYLERKNRIHDAHEALRSLFSDLRTALASKKLGPVATRIGEELLAAVDLEDGKWKGHTVDSAALDALAEAKDEPTLRLFVARLPSEELRTEAKRRIVRLHIDASPFPEVRANADDVEERVLIRGANPVALDKQPPQRGWLDDAHVPMRGVLVRQDVYAQTATLLGYKTDALSVLPELALREALMVDVMGISRPVTLCAPKKELDPSPCVATSDERIANPLAYLDRGVFRFVDRIPEKTAVELVPLRERFELPIEVGGKSLASFSWPFHYERPPALVLSGVYTGEVGPKLSVRVDVVDDGRFVFDVVSPAREYLAVVESYDAASFVVASSGSQGVSGSTGTSGSAGSSGSECSNGGDGSPGGPGGDGGDGGDGGNVDVELHCTGTACASALATLQRTIGSVGGAGGPGGAGGSGGPGGSGGSGRSPTTHTDENGNTVTDDPGCSPGSSGSSGSDGIPGSNGSSGHPGRVTLHMITSSSPRR